MYYHMFFWSSFFWQLWPVGCAGCTVFGCLWQTSLCWNFGQQFFRGPRYVVNSYCLLSDELQKNIQYQYIVPNTNRKWCIIKHQVPNTNRIWCIIKIKFPIYLTNLNTVLPFTTNFFTMFSWPRCYRVRFTLIRFSQLLPLWTYVKLFEVQITW